MSEPQARQGQLRLCVFIGRFQPFHTGHLHVLEQALSQAQAGLRAGLGSAHLPRSTRNPWTWHERAAMIAASVPAEQLPRVLIRPLPDFEYNETQWVEAVQAAVAGVLGVGGADDAVAGVALIGHSKDRSSYYLRRFPQWQSVEAASHRGLSSTPMREAYFSKHPRHVAAGQRWTPARRPAPGPPGAAWRPLVPDPLRGDAGVRGGGSGVRFHPPVPGAVGGSPVCANLRDRGCLRGAVPVTCCWSAARRSPAGGLWGAAGRLPGAGRADRGCHVA